MFAVIYRWRMVAAKEDDFLRSWELLTGELLANGGSLGSRLHRASDGTWVPYAQWPSHEAWERAAVVGAEAQAALVSMAAAVEERIAPILLEPVADYLVTNVPPCD